MGEGGSVLVILGLLFGAILLARALLRGGRRAKERAAAAHVQETRDLLVELQEENRRRQNAAALRPVAAFMRVPLTAQQREHAFTAHAFLHRDDPAMAERFAVEPDGLRAPCDAEMLSVFAAQGLWKIEATLEIMLRKGEITKAKKLSYHRSLRSLENKMYACLDDKKRRIA